MTAASDERIVIVKVQPAIVPSSGPVLVYDRTRSVFETYGQETAVGRKLLKALDGAFKGYFRAHAVPDNLRLIERVADETW